MAPRARPRRASGGGGPGETLPAALARELDEETGWVLQGLLCYIGRVQSYCISGGSAWSHAQ